MSAMLSGARTFDGRVFLPVSGRLDLDAINILERVLDSGDRTIAIDAIATVSVGLRTHRLVRWLCWGFATLALLLSSNGLLAVWWLTPTTGSASTAIFLASALGYIAIATGLVFLGRWFRDVPVLVVTTTDGSSTVFRSRNTAYLHDMKNALARKINERDLTLKFAADFKSATTRAIEHNDYGAAAQQLEAGPPASNPGSRRSTSRPAVEHRDSRAENPAGYSQADGFSRTGYHEDGSSVAYGAESSVPLGGYAAQHVTVTQLPPGQLSFTGQFEIAHVDFSAVLPQIVELHRYYAQHPDMDHIEQRLSELELLMRSGAASPEHKHRIRDLADDLRGILHSYPAMTHLFNQVAAMV